MAHDFQEELLISGDQYSCLLARLATIERDLNAVMVWCETVAKRDNLPPPAWSGRTPRMFVSSSPSSTT